MTTFRDEDEQPLLEDHSSDVSSTQSTKCSSESRENFRAYARIVGCCVSCASAGWHDGCIGALIPYLQLYYEGVTDEKVSLVFLGSFTGYILASLLNVPLSNRLGLGRLIMLGATVQGIASAVIASRPPFLAITVCYAFAGFGLALQDAQFNTYIARLPGAATKLGILHALYGVGALASPVAATLLMRAKVPPPTFYFTNLGWCIVSVAVLISGFGFGGNTSSNIKSQTEGEDNRKVASLKTVISSRVVWTALIFITLYTGSETTEAGWVVSFLMRQRNGGSMSGYASAAFYAGLTSSRIMLLPLTIYLREKKAVCLYVAIALAMQIVIWTSSSFIVAFVAVAACGFVMGPVYPVTVSLVTKATPHRYHPGALSLMACVGQSGSALFPFLVGSLADVYGIKVLQPILASLFGAMVLLWQLVPSPKEVGSSATSIFEDSHSTVVDNSDQV